MNNRYMRAASIGVALMMFVSATASGLQALVPTLASAAGQAFRGHPGSFTDRPVPIRYAERLSRDPETRGGAWSASCLADIQNTVQSCFNPPPGEPIHSTAVAAEPGSTFPWEASVAGNSGEINSGNGNKLTTIPLVSWKCRGGMVLDFTIYHNSQTNYNDELGYGWSWTYDIYINDLGSTATVHWGDGLCVPFSMYSGGGGGSGGIETGNSGVQNCSPKPKPTATTYYPPTGIYDSLVKNNDGTWTLTKKNQVKYYFNTSGFCNQIQDRNGNSITITLNGNNYATRVTDPSGRYIDISVTNGKFNSITDPMGRTWSFTRNASNDLTTVTWPTLDSTNYTDGFMYSSHRITRHTDRRGKYWDNTYNSDGSVATEKDPLNHTTTYGYTATAFTATDALNHTTTYTYANGKLASVTDPCGYSVGYTYDSSKNVTRVTDKRGKYWDYTYDSMGNVLTAQDPYDHTTTYTYNSKNDVLTVTDPLSHTWTVTRNTNGIPTAITDPLNHSTSIEWDSNGQPTSITDPLSHTTTLTFNTNGALIEVEDPLGHSAYASYNDLSQITSTHKDLTNSIHISYDEWHRPVSTMKSDLMSQEVMTHATYNAVGQIASYGDEANHYTALTYDDAGRLTSVTNANNETETYTYDNADRVTSITNARDKTTVYTYNDRGEVLSQRLPDNSVEYWSYNGNGDTTAYTNPLGQVIYYAYDDAGRMTGVDYPTGTDITYSYDIAGRQTQMVDSTGTTSWSYDNANRLTGLSTPQGNMSYTYDNADRRITMVDSAGTTTYSYDDADRLTSLQNQFNETTTWTYDAADRTTRQTFASGAYTDYAYDCFGRPEAITHKKPDNSVISSETYDYANNNNLTSKTVDSVVTNYTYDAIDQLLTESRTGYSCSYTYDANGNRLSKTLNNVTESYTYDDADKMLTAGSKTYTYDAAGRTTAVTSGGQTTQFTYNYEDQIVQIRYPNNTTNTFAYNGADTRVCKTDSSGVKTYRRDGVDVDDDILSDGATTFTPGISYRTTGITKYILDDRMGTTVKEVDGSYASSLELQLDAFGVITGKVGSSTSPFSFKGAWGYHSDEDSGLYLLGYRYYDSTTGRFLTRDPSSFGRNLYIYCDNNPLSYVDPLGLMPDWMHIGLDIIGVFDPTGIADGVNAIGYALEGDHENAAMCLVSMVPGGDVLKCAKYTYKVVKGGSKVLKGGKTAGKAVKNVVKKKVKRQSVRKGLEKRTGKEAGEGCDAHHMMPVKLHAELLRRWPHLKKWLNNPAFARWWEKSSHRKWAYEYNRLLEKWLEDNPNGTWKQFMQYADKVYKDLSSRT